MLMGTGGSGSRRHRSVRSRTLTPELGPLRSEPLERGDQLWREGRLDDALHAYTEELERSAADHFTRGMAHKRVVTLLAERDGIDAAFAHYELARIDARELTIAPGEVLLCATVQDEAERLPFFLDYYERLGVDRFLFIDNGSHDATRALLLERPNVHVWASAMRYWRANYGMAWVDLILYAHARGHWCVIVDTDEHLWYPGVEQRDLHQLCTALDRESAVAMQAVLLDMYSETAIRDASCPPGSDPSANTSTGGSPTATRSAPLRGRTSTRSGVACAGVCSATSPTCS